VKRLNLSRIEDLMLTKGVSQSALAESLQVSRESVSQWLQGNKFPRPAALLALGKLLGLPFGELVMVDRDQTREPQVAFRTNKKKTEKPQDKEMAQDMAEGLRPLFPHLPPPPVTMSPTFASPTVDRSFVLEAGQYLRRVLGDGSSQPIPLGAIVQGLVEQGVCLVPVLWGPNGHDGLHIHFPADRRSFIYVNLDKKVTDFRFWLLHEWMHELTPAMPSAEAEALADLVPAEVLFPEAEALRFLQRRTSHEPASHWIAGIVAEALRLDISTICVWKQLERVAELKKRRLPEIDIFPVEGKRLKAVPSVGETLWGPGTIEVGGYIQKASEAFHTPIFDALSKRIRDHGAEPNFVERVLKVPVGDTGGIHGYLASR
jgi:transcriptional regulator with XRE-family HTH domain